MLGRVQLFATPWTTARQASLSITNSRSSLKLMEKKLLVGFQSLSGHLVGVGSVSGLLWCHSDQHQSHLNSWSHHQAVSDPPASVHDVPSSCRFFRILGSTNCVHFNWYYHSKCLYNKIYHFNHLSVQFSDILYIHTISRILLSSPRNSMKQFLPISACPLPFPGNH